MSQPMDAHKLARLLLLLPEGHKVTGRTRANTGDLAIVDGQGYAGYIDFDEAETVWLNDVEGEE